MLCWNVRGLNGRARRNVVRQLVVDECLSLICLQETRLSVVCNRLINERRRRHGLQATVTRVLCEFQGTASAPSVLLQLINEEAREWAVTGYRHLQSLRLLRVLLCSFTVCRAAACVIAGFTTGLSEAQFALGKKWAGKGVFDECFLLGTRQGKVGIKKNPKK